MIRVGQGFDIHRHVEGKGADAGQPGRRLVIGGCVFDGAPPLVGHSDADVAAHAAADALLGAAGLGDIGLHFPDDDPRWKDADSIDLLSRVAELVRGNGWAIENIDIKVVCERPRLAPRIDEMQRNLSEAVGAPVTVAGRRAEGLGAIGRQEGIAAWSVALITSHQEDG